LFKKYLLALCACLGGKGFYSTKSISKNKDAYITYISLGKQIMIFVDIFIATSFPAAVLLALWHVVDKVANPDALVK
jgi:hypothetical protein